ncbi:AEC family transporter [bacterium]|nr:AEC family transporter [bacterium]
MISIFLTLFEKIAPLYIFIILGFIATKKLKTQKESIASILIYIISPTIIFYGTYKAKIELETLSLPLFFLLISILISTTFLKIGDYFYKNNSTKNILAFTSGTGNSGYFGIPVVIALFGDKGFSLAVLSVLGFVLYENTLGFFITARGNFTKKESFIKVIKLPAIYAFSIALLLNLFGIKIHDNIITLIEYFKGAYTLLGMMMIGMGLAHLSLKKIDYKFILLTFFSKFIIWPTIVSIIIFIDKNFTNIYSSDIYSVFKILSVVPLAANTVAIAAELKTQPEKAATAVFASTIFALFYIPFILTIL